MSLASRAQAIFLIPGIKLTIIKPKNLNLTEVKKKKKKKKKGNSLAGKERVPGHLHESWF